MPPAKGSRGGAASGNKAPADTGRVPTTQAKAGKDAAKDPSPARPLRTAANAGGATPKAGPKAPKA
ncbi:hypothetical protein C2E23DRAFT_741117 [Lenzites betulinus]|nr:hypothetical protein C2E23DRAFT_741117 [Lenzites betulinus]